MKENVLFFVDESYDENFFAVCIVCIQGKENLKILIDQIRQIKIDPVINTYNQSKTFHYNEDNVSARQSLVPWISEMPISVYIAISRKNIPESKLEKDKFVYHHLFPEILKPIVIKYSKKIGTNISFSIRFENLSDKISNDKSFFEDVLKKTLNFRNIDVKVVTKDTESLIFLPDYFLGFVRDFLVDKKKQTWPADSLKLLCSKIGLILLSDHEIVTHYERGEEIYNFLS